MTSQEMNVFAQRDVTYDAEAQFELQELVESTPFGCRTLSVQKPESVRFGSSIGATARKRLEPVT